MVGVELCLGEARIVFRISLSQATLWVILGGWVIEIYNYSRVGVI